METQEMKTTDSLDSPHHHPRTVATALAVAVIAMGTALYKAYRKFGRKPQADKPVEPSDR